ncbi:MAG: HDOD domain-containing protein [Candidatus Krumholzibacteriia bacterium]
MATATSMGDQIRRTVKDLPPLPTVVTKLVRVVGDDSSSAEDVTRVLAGDPALAAKVLKLVNSSFYGQSGEIATITRAVVVLGFATVRNLALGLAAGGALKQAGGADYQRRFWTHALATACAADALVRHCGLACDPEEAFVAGLLHDVGHPVLALAAPQEFAAVFGAGPEGRLEREETAFGLGHTKAGQMLLRHWKLPGFLGEAARFHHHGKICTGGETPLVSVVCLADVLAGIVDEVYECSATEADLPALLKVVGLDAAHLGEVLQATAARVRENRAFLEIATDGEIGAAAPVDRPPLAVTVVGTEPARVRWVQGILGFHGCPAVPMRAFFAGETAADLVLVDRPGVGDEQLAKLAPALAAVAARLRALGDPLGTVAAAVGRPAPGLSLVFSRADLG